MPKPIAMAPANAASVRSSHTKSNAIDRPAFFTKILYQARACIEQAVGKLKRFKRLALRCEKTAQNYASFVALALASSRLNPSTRPLVHAGQSCAGL